MSIRSPHTVLISLSLLLAFASPAAAFEPPELFARTAGSPAGEWVPLASAPQLDFMGGWEIGYRVQPGGDENNIHSAALTVRAVPDGAPDQRRNNATPICVTSTGAVGEIVPVGYPVVYEGNGSYTVSVSIGAHHRFRGDTCFEGASNTGTLSTNIAVTPEVVGTPVTERFVPLSGDLFSGVRAADPPGGLTDIQCAVDAQVQPDGSLRGRARIAGENGNRVAAVRESMFFPPGAWTCVARGVVEADLETPLGENEDVRYNASPWSAPIAVTVKSDFRRDWVEITNPRKRRITWTYKADLPHAAVGGTGTLETIRLVRCRRDKAVYKRVSRGRGTFDAKGRVKITLPKPKVKGNYFVRLSISGAPFYVDGPTRGLISFKVADEGRLIRLPHFPVC